MRRLLIAGSLLLAIAATVATGFLLWPVWLAPDVVHQVGPATRSGVADGGRQEAAAIAVRGQFAAIVRHLSILQDSAVDGGNGAFAEQERHLQRAAKEIDEAPPEVWQEPNNPLSAQWRPGAPRAAPSRQKDRTRETQQRRRRNAGVR